MKSFVYILAVTLLAVSAFPCCAFDECEEDDAGRGVTVAPFNGGCSGTPACSPMFLCKSCVNAGFSIQRFDLPSPLSLQTRAIHSVIAHVPPRFQQSIWRPPKVS